MTPHRTSAQHGRPARRSFDRDAQSRVERLGVRSPLVLGDWYHSLLVMSWARLGLLVLAGYLLGNALFACGYWIGGGVDGMATWADAFFFSVQTMCTIGYGRMVPASLTANLLVTVEALSGLLGFAMVTGLVFSKFARPTARVLFSRVMVVSVREGVPTLVLRMANERSNTIVEATIRLSLLRDEQTAEGERIRRVVDLPLVRGMTPVFSLSWLAQHTITPSSPLWGYTPERLAETKTEFIVSLVGIDATFSSTVHVRHAYSWDDVRFDERFVDIFGMEADGRRVVDYTKFHETTPAAPTIAEWTAAERKKAERASAFNPDGMPT